ncbi:MAG: NAD(P)-dependent alcohol dehydrogenase [Polyangiaceae bacterium]|nr:NAD(P)-dependent alcohol dehydrogenase [Polyangiaceae bacterium]
MYETLGYAARAARAPLEPHRFERRALGAADLLIEIAYCGVCHSDIHQARDEWGGATFPMVPGHEIVGTVVATGAAVKRFRAGDRAGVGCMVDACRRCAACLRGLESYCEQHVSWTYNGTEQDRKTPTQGGYSTQIVVDERFALRIRADQPLERVAPLLCAGITTWSPLRHWKVGAGSRVAVAGLGGLGHMAVKLAASLGAEVTLLSTSAGKRADAARLGAHEFVLATDDEAMARVGGRYDLVLDTIAAKHSLDRYLGLLRLDGALVLVGAPDKPLELGAFSLIPRRRSVAGSLIGGIAETQEMLDWCADHGIGADVETIPVAGVNEAYERMLRSDVRYRFVLDVASLRR